MQFVDGISPSSGMPEAPSASNTTNTLANVRRMFRAWLRDSGNDYTRAEGYGQPTAWVTLRVAWDGISYGDYPVALFVRGPRGGIVREGV